MYSQIAQQVRQEVLEVAEVDLRGGDEHREPGGDHREQRRRAGITHSMLRAPTGSPATTVDRDVDEHRRQEAHERVITDDSGSSTRGKAVLRMSRPPETDLRARRIESETK